jgi:HPt (histidine-containing phosphotransfer) domain-containing protein
MTGGGELPELPLLAAKTVGQVRELGGDELLRRLVGLLLELTPQRLDLLRDAMRRGDLAAARMAVHALSSTAGIVGATRLLDAAQRVEKAPGAPEARAAAEALEGEWRRLQEPLQGWLDRPERSE